MPPCQAMPRSLTYSPRPSTGCNAAPNQLAVNRLGRLSTMKSKTYVQIGDGIYTRTTLQPIIVCVIQIEIAGLLDIGSMREVSKPP